MPRSIPPLAAIFVAAFVTAFAAHDAAAPLLVEQINGGNWLPHEEAEKLRNELFLSARGPRLHDRAAGAQRDRDA